jgi:hypothetical protein
VIEVASALVERAGLAAGGAIGVRVLSGGANNRVFEVEGASRPVVLKAYFQGGPRDRLESEWAFCSYAWERGITTLPEPIARDRDAGAALYSLLPGRRLAAGAVEERHVRQARAFVEALQAGRDAAALPDGAEACSSTTEHLELVGARVERLARIEDPDARRLVDGHVRPAWERVAARVRPDDEPVERCVSPSDFGFHNALVDAGGTVRFLDFEYAGWDDPAKLLCDFFCQPEVPVGLEHWPSMAAAAPAEAAERARLLLDVYRIKWCCIMLNEFLPSGARRRGYALGSLEPRRREPEQLAKVRAALDELGSEPPRED